MLFRKHLSFRSTGALAAAVLVAVLALFVFGPGDLLASGSSNWHASYWNNRDLHGHPTVVRYEQAIDYDWHGLSPDVSIKVDNFSARWVREHYFHTGTYKFSATMDDGMRVYLNGRLIIDDWAEANVRTREATVNLKAGTYKLVVEYFEAGGNAVAGFTWVSTDGQPVHPIEPMPPHPPQHPQPPTVRPPTGGIVLPTAEVKAAFLNVRAAPGASQPVVGVLRQNTIVRMHARSSGGGWILISTDGLQGWVNKYYLHTDFPFTSLPVSGATTPPTKPQPPVQGNTGVVNASMLNVRSGPGVSFPVIAVLRGGTQVSIIQRDYASSWVKVGIPGAGQGWVNGAYISTN